MKSENNLFFLFYGLNYFGQSIYYITLPLFLYNTTNSATVMGTMSVLQSLPIIFLSAFIGVIIDKNKPYLIMAISSISQVILLLCMYIYTIHTMNIIFIYTIGFLLSVNNQFFKLSMLSSIPTLFDNIKYGNSKISTINSVVDLGSPFLGAFIMSFVSLNFIFLLCSFTSILFFAFLYITKNKITYRSKQQKISNRSYRLIDSFKTLSKNKELNQIILIVLISNISDAGLLQLMLFHLSDTFKLESSFISIILGISSLGSLAGSLLLQVKTNYNAKKMFFYGVLINNLGLLLLLINRWYMVPISFIIVSFGSVIATIIQNILIQSVSSKDTIGQINGIVRMLLQITKIISVSLLMTIANNINVYISIKFALLMTLVTTFLLFKFKLQKGDLYNENSNN